MLFAQHGLSLSFAILCYVLISYSLSGRNRKWIALNHDLERIGLKCRNQISSDGKLSLLGRKASVSEFQEQSINVPSHPCQYSRQSIEFFLSMPHNCSRGGSRIFINEVWMTSFQLQNHLKNSATAFNSKVACAIFCVKDSVPCPHATCLIPVYMRPNSSDVHRALAVFERGELDALKPEWDMRVILDAEGGIGISALAMAFMYPEAIVITVEPDELEYEVLLLNSHALSKILPVRTALHSSIEPIPCLRPQQGQGTRVGQSAEKSYQGMSVESLLGMFMLPHIDLLRLSGRAADRLSRLKTADLRWLTQGKFALVEGTERSDPLTAVFQKSSDWKYMGRWKVYKVLKSRKLDSG